MSRSEIESLIGAFAFGSDKASTEDGEDSLNVGARFFGRGFSGGSPMGAAGAFWRT